jgi:hypothetical protein
MRAYLQLDTAYAPQPRTDGKWVNDGGTFKAEHLSPKLQEMMDKQLSFRSSLEKTFQIERLNSSLSIKQTAEIIIPPGVHA